MSNSSAKGLAAVEPRARSSDGELLPIVDLIETHIRSDTLAIRIVGEGKSTAIAHLRERFDGYPNVRFLDDGKPVGNLSQWNLTVFTSPTFVAGEVVMKLARWSRDECIEYLIAKAPARCKSVMSRLVESDDLWLASGSPRVLSRALDSMIESDEILSIEMAINAYFDAIPFERKRHRAKVVSKCLKNLFSDVKLAMDLQKYVPGFIDQETIKILSVQTVRYVLTAKHLISSLEWEKTPDCLSQLWTPEWIEYFSDVLEREGSALAIGFLEILANKVLNSNSANSASVLYELDSNWRPTRQNKLNLEYVQLPRIKVRELILENSLISKANLSEADLSFCSLENSIVTGTDLSNSNLSNGNLRQLVARHANLSAALLRNVNAQQSSFSSACLVDANLEGSDFSRANFISADLCGANLKYTKFSGSDLTECKLAGASLVGAWFEMGKLDAIDFRTVDLTESRFRDCSLRDANFEEQELHCLEFSSCDLTSSLFSNSRFDKCTIRNCNLRNAKLGDIVWTDCDLSKTDFSGCHFHYGSTRSGLVGSPYPSHGTRTGFYTDDYDDQHYRRVENIRKASLQGCDLTGAKVLEADFYLVDLRGAKYEQAKRRHFQSCGAILSD